MIRRDAGARDCATTGRRGTGAKKSSAMFFLNAALLLGSVIVPPAHADEKLDKSFEALDAAFLEFLADEAQNAAADPKETELALWLRDWWNPTAALPEKQQETRHENH